VFKRVTSITLVEKISVFENSINKSRAYFSNRDKSLGIFVGD